jgi:hypothetical protein
MEGLSWKDSLWSFHHSTGIVMGLRSPTRPVKLLACFAKKGAGIHFPGTYMNDDLKREARSLIEKIVNLRDSL